MHPLFVGRRGRVRAVLGALAEQRSGSSERVVTEGPVAAAGCSGYEETLGLRVVATEGDQVLTFKTGGSMLNVYVSQFAGTNRATAVTFGVGKALDGLVRDLSAKDVPFEHYEMPETKLDGHVHVMGQMRVAWFKDPDGNILNLIDQ